MTHEKPNPGPDPERLKIDGDWEDAVDRALGKKRPEGGWPGKDKPAKGEPKPDKGQKPDQG